MKKKYIYALFSIFISMLQISCANNDDEPVPTPPSPDDKLEVTNENIKGSWELYYFSKKLGNKGEELRYLVEDGYSVTFLPKNSEGKLVFKEQDASGRITREGTYDALGNDSVKFTFKSDITQKDTVTLSYISKLSKERLVTYDEYVRQLKGTNTTYNVFDTRLFRNISTAADNLEGAKDIGAAIITEKLIGKWQVYAYESYVGGSADPNLEKLREDYLGIIYYYYKTADGKLKFELYKKNNNEYVLSDKGDVAVINDVIHLYFIVKETGENGQPGKDVEYHLAIRVKDWEEKIVDGQKTETFVDYARYMSFLENATTPVSFETLCYMKRIE